MITDGFFYFATLVFMAALLVGAQKVTKAKFFEYVPPVVLLYLAAMLGCTFKLWDPAATKGAYSALRNPILYAMIFVMLATTIRITFRKKIVTMTFSSLGV